MKIFLFMIFLSINTYSFDECHDLTSDCEFYSCAEKQKHCGKKSYLIGFGHKYCNKFEKRKYKFSSEGKRWIEEVKRCLIRKLDNVENQLSCKRFKKIAIKHHVPCYINSGYCALSKKDKKSVIKNILGSLWRPSLIKAGLKILSICKNQ